MSTDEEFNHSDTDPDEIHPSQWHSKSLGGLQYFNCKVCGELLNSHADFQRHLLAHHDQNKPFSCDECHKQFKNWYPFQQHLHNSCCNRIVSKHMPFLCKECGKQFRYKSGLAHHLLTVHCSDRPYCCNKCDATFKVEYNLARHQITVHHEAKPYSCNQCNEKFKLKSDLQSHLRAIHSKVGSFTCNKCSAIFCDRKTIIAHIRTHHPERPFSCIKCNLKFKVKGWLQNHMVQVHHIHELAAIQNVSNVEGDEILNKVKHTVTHGSEFSKFQQDTTAANNEGNQLEQASGSNFCQHLQTSPSVTCEEHTLFNCHLCDKTFKLRMCLQQHLQRKHGADCEGYRADNSVESSSDEGNDDGDIKTTTSIISQSFVTCPSCLKIFKEYQELQDHARTCKKYLLFIKNESKCSRRALKTQEYGCSICDLTLFHAADLKAHLSEQHNIKFFYHLCPKSSCKK